MYADNISLWLFSLPQFYSFSPSEWKVLPCTCSCFDFSALDLFTHALIIFNSPMHVVLLLNMRVQFSLRINSHMTQHSSTCSGLTSVSVCACLKRRSFHNGLLQIAQTNLPQLFLVFDTTKFISSLLLNALCSLTMLWWSGHIWHELSPATMWETVNHLVIGRLYSVSHMW